MVTRKHFVAIAKIIRESLNIDQLIDKLCLYFAGENSQFNEEKFRQQCRKEEKNAKLLRK